MRWAGHEAHMGDRRGPYRVLLGSPEGKQPLGRPTHRWEDYYTDLQGVVRGGMDWVCLAQDRERQWAFVDTVRNLQVP